MLANNRGRVYIRVVAPISQPRRGSTNVVAPKREYKCGAPKWEHRCVRFLSLVLPSMLCLQSEVVSKVSRTACAL